MFKLSYNMLSTAPMLIKYRRVSRHSQVKRRVTDIKDIIRDLSSELVTDNYSGLSAERTECSNETDSTM